MREHTIIKNEVIMGIDTSTPFDASRVLFECDKLKEKGAQVFTIGKSILGTPIPCIKLGQKDECSLFVGAHHGMEHITAGILLKFAENIASLQTNEYRNSIYIVPMINPDGCELAINGIGAARHLKDELLRMNGGSDFSRWQANARGVDLNHNYNAGFDIYKEIEKKLGIPSGGPTRYSGEHSESEPETKALCNLTRTLSEKLKVVVALHTQGEEIYYDYNGKSPRGSRELAEKLSRISGYAMSSPDEIASYGGYKDWVIDKFDIPAFTIECGKGKNPLPQSDFDGIMKKTEPILYCASFF